MQLNRTARGPAKKPARLPIAGREASALCGG